MSDLASLVFSEENFEILKDAYLELKVRYDERGACMRDTGDQVRSLFQGSEVSKRIREMQLEIERLNNLLASACILLESRKDHDQDCMDSKDFFLPDETCECDAISVQRFLKEAHYDY